MGSYVELEFFPDAPPSIVGNLATGGTASIEIWRSGVAVSITSSVCSEIDATGRYSWSTGNIATMSASREQFHWRMSDSFGNTDEGDVILLSVESDDGGMPSLSDPSSYIVQN